MSSHARSSRKEERRLSVRTLVIASIASALAAIITSRFWTAGTPIAAAVSPVIVTLVSELLHRPTQKITQRFTAETDALPPQTDAVPEAAGAGPPPRSAEHEPRPAREPPAREPTARGTPAREGPEFRVYQSRPATARRIPWKLIFSTAAIAFVLAAAVLTLPELIAGQSFGAGDRTSTLFGGGGREKKKESPAEPEQTQSAPARPETEAVPREQTVPEAQPKQPESAPKTPEPTQPPPQSTPAPRAPPPAPQEP